MKHANTPIALEINIGRQRDTVARGRLLPYGAVVSSNYRFDLLVEYALSRNRFYLVGSPIIQAMVAHVSFGKVLVGPLLYPLMCQANSPSRMVRACCSNRVDLLHACMSWWPPT